MTRHLKDSRYPSELWKVIYTYVAHTLESNDQICDTNFWGKRRGTNVPIITKEKVLSLGSSPRLRDIKRTLRYVYMGDVVEFMIRRVRYIENSQL